MFLETDGSMRDVVRKWLKASPELFRIQRRVRYRLGLLDRSNLTVAERLEDLVRKTQPVRFLQVGSNDGRYGDPIVGLIKRRGNWAGVFVEPVPYAYQRLKENYGGAAKFVFENVAVSAKEEKRKFYYVDEKAKTDLGEQIPPWYDQLGSFEREHILKHLDGILEPYIVDVEIDCIPLSEILKRNAVESLDLVHIDTEGFDYQVLKQLDLDALTPRIVLFEHKHLSAEEQELARQMLLSRDYTLEEISGDTLAVSNKW